MESLQIHTCQFQFDGSCQLRGKSFVKSVLAKYVILTHHPVVVEMMALVSNDYCAATTSLYQKSIKSTSGVPLFGFGLQFLRYEYAAEAIKYWFLETILYQVCGGIVLGAILGYTANILLKISEGKGWIDKKSFLSFEIALAVSQSHTFYSWASHADTKIHSYSPLVWVRCLTLHHS